MRRLVHLSLSIRNCHNGSFQWSRRSNNIFVENLEVEKSTAKTLHYFVECGQSNLLTLNGQWSDFVSVRFCKLLNALADRMVEKTLE